MALIKPFKAYRPALEETAQIASLPYDVYSEKEARDYVKEHPGCFLSLDRPETFFPEGQDPYAKEVYNRAASEYNKMKEEGHFVQDEKPCFYLYEQTFAGRSQTGLVALASVDEYLDNQIKKHENTRQEKEMDRIKHVNHMDAQTGPIFLTYKARTDIQLLVHDIKKESPIYEFCSSGGVLNRAWMIQSEEYIRQITDAFANVDSLYIADGHHRAASAVKVCQMRREADGTIDPSAEYNGFLSVIFPDEELCIYDYNRVVKDLCGRTAAEFLEALWPDFVVTGPFTEQIKPAVKGEIGMFLMGRWYKLVMKPELKSDDPVEGLDVSILQKYILEKHLNIMDPKTDSRIDFVGGIRGLDELEKRCSEDAAVAFAMYPTSMDELIRVADAGLLMPPKSTWFEPKLLSGLFIHELK